MARVEVLHCAETIKGGIATYLRELLPLQAETFGAQHVVVVVPASQASELPVPAGVQLVTFPDAGGRVGNAIALTKAVHALTKTHQVEIAHIHSTFSGASVRPFLRLAARRIRIVYCPHGWAWDRPMKEWKKTLVKLFERALSVCSEKIVCISEFEREGGLLAGISPRRLVVVLNGIVDVKPTSAPPPPPPASGPALSPGVTDTSPPVTGEPSAATLPPAWPNAHRRLLFVGRFDRQKGVDLFCDALRQLDGEACALLVGDHVLGGGPQFEIPPNVRAVGWLKPAQLQALYATAQTLIVPSRWEGFGLVAAEGMRAALPVIASSVGGLPEVVEDGVTGVVLQRCDGAAIAAAVRSMSDDDVRRMGDAGRRRFEAKFTIQRVHNDLMAVYRAV